MSTSLNLAISWSRLSSCCALVSLPDDAHTPVGCSPDAACTLDQLLLMLSSGWRSEALRVGRSVVQCSCVCSAHTALFLSVRGPQSGTSYPQARGTLICFAIARNGARLGRRRRRRRRSRLVSVALGGTCRQLVVGHVGVWCVGW